MTKNDKMIIDLIAKDGQITINKMAEIINVSRITVIRSINKLTNLEIIRRIGSNKNGHWEVLKRDAKNHME